MDSKYSGYTVPQQKITSKSWMEEEYSFTSLHEKVKKTFFKIILTQVIYFLIVSALFTCIINN